MNSPRIIAFANQKGGAGKTTGAVHAADWFASQNLSVLLVDADGQQSSSAWLKEIELDYKTLIDPEQLFEDLPKFSSEYDVVIVDGPGSLSEVTKAILARCDMVLVPSRDSIIDLRSTGKVLQYIDHAKELRDGKPAAALYLNAVSKNTVLLREAQEALDLATLPLMKSVIYDRQCVKDSPGQGTTVFRMKGRPARDSSRNFEALFKEAMEYFPNV